MVSPTFFSDQDWIIRHQVRLNRYLRKFHKRKDIPHLLDMMISQYPAEGRRLIEFFHLHNLDKLNIFLDWLILQPAITCAGFGDQRMGKDATVCYLFTEALRRCKELGKEPPRIVTLGNTKKPPFVDEWWELDGQRYNITSNQQPQGWKKCSDMYFSFLNIPSGTKEKEVWIYCSEIETVLPAREGMAPENKLFSQLAGTLAQNHQKLFGLAKLASRVDINFLRDCNAKFFKFISPEKLNVENIERDGMLSDLGRWLLPKNIEDKSAVLLAFNNQLFQINHGLPDWYDDNYSEMFRNVQMDKVWEYIEVLFGNEMDINSIRISVAQKFRKKMSVEEISSHFGINMKPKNVTSYQV